MSHRLKESLYQLSQGEKGAYKKLKGTAHSVALLYPNRYFVGMSNLGLQIIYKEINERNDSLCERFFLPEKEDIKEYEKTKTALMSVESQRPLYDFEVIGVDMTFEMDYFHLPLLLRLGKVTLWAKDRTPMDAYVIAGGPCATFNPEPFANFVDACIIGEGEEVIHEVLETIYASKREGMSREATLLALAQIKGIYVPSLYEPLYEEEQQVAFDRQAGAPVSVSRRWGDLEEHGESVVATEFTEFGAMYLLEVARGCGRHCRFCMAGYCYRKPRVRTLESLKEGVDRALATGKKIGLMGAAISDYPQIDELVTYIREKGLRFSCASLRADTLTWPVVKGLAESGQKTITIAPEAGSERLRRVINKGISNEDLFKAITMASEAGIQHIRMYIMIGLPTEEWEDVEEIVRMAKATLQHMDEVGCKGRLTLSVNPFIPKPFTPFQWMPMAHHKDIDKKLTFLKREFKKNKRIEVLAESPREAYVQGVLARGDRRLNEILLEAVNRGGAKAFKNVCKDFDYSMEDNLYTERKVEDFLPWSILDMKLSEGYLWREWQAGIAERYTAPCRDNCRRCGVCVPEESK